MNIEELRDYCLSRAGAEETFPFGEETLVFKVGGKMFALTGLDDSEVAINLKCEPSLAIELREHYPCVQPGYHMNKKHWNTVYIDGSVDSSTIKDWINHSYQLVVSTLPKKEKDRLAKK